MHDTIRRGRKGTQKSGLLLCVFCVFCGWFPGRNFPTGKALVQPFSDALENPIGFSLPQAGGSAPPAPVQLEDDFDGSL